MGFEAHLVKLDQVTNDRLGDDVSYDHDGRGAAMIKARLFFPAEADEGAYVGIDPLNQAVKLKVLKSIVDVPTESDIINHPRLGVPHTVGPYVSIEGDRYWLIDLQKV